MRIKGEEWTHKLLPWLRLRISLLTVLLLLLLLRAKNTSDVSNRFVSTTTTEAAKKKLRLLVVVGDTENWYELLRGVADDDVDVEQSTWDELSLCSYASGGGADDDVVIRLLPARSPVDPRQQVVRTMHRPDLVLVRTFARGVSGCLGRNADWRNALFGLQHAGVPMMNTFASLLAELDRPLMYGALHAIQRRLGSARFPLISQTFYPSMNEAVVAPFPAVCKVGFPHAGFGKMRVENSEDFEDFAGVVAVGGSHMYWTAEPFVADSDFEIRIVKIGSYVRAHKRMGCGWKVNTGASVREDVPMNDRWMLWVQEASKVFGGLDILTVDAIVDKQGREFILEVNGSESGLAPEHELEAMLAMRDLVLNRLRSFSSTATASSTSSMATTTEEQQQLVVTTADTANMRNRVSELELANEALERTATSLRLRTKAISSTRSAQRVQWFAIGCAVGCALAFMLLRLFAAFL